MPETALRTEAITKQFGGLTAVRDVSLELLSGEIHAIIGPNGAGKTTFINLLSGDLPPTAGRILLGARDITRLPAHRVARLGVGRSYQKTNIFPAFTCYRNCWLAAQARLPSSFRFLRPARAYAGIHEAVERALKMVELTARAQVPAAAVSHGEQRQLEVAMLLATEPRVLLLDEPMAGMGPEESERVVALIRRLSGPHTILLIEHDMDAVFAVADRITVMVNGAVLESGTPDASRASARVRDAYLGDELPEPVP